MPPEQEYEEQQAQPCSRSRSRSRKRRSWFVVMNLQSYVEARDSLNIDDTKAFWKRPSLLQKANDGDSHHQEEIAEEQDHQEQQCHEIPILLMPMPTPTLRTTTMTTPSPLESILFSFKHRLSWQLWLWNDRSILSPLLQGRSGYVDIHNKSKSFTSLFRFCHGSVEIRALSVCPSYDQSSALASLVH
jgi:hypothetical protein